MSFDFKAVICRGLAFAVGLGAAKLAAKTGVVVDPATQASVVIGCYAGLHKVFAHFLPGK